MSASLRAALVLLALPIHAGCSESPPSAPAAAPVTRWASMPDGFEPVLLPDATDSCDGTTIWVGTDAVHAVAEEEGSPALGEPDLSDLPRGVAREVAEVTRPISGLRVMTSAYNGPGGEPLFRWRMGDGTRVVVLFDRRISPARFAAALQGAANEYGSPVQIGGVDERGGRRCASVLLGGSRESIRDVSSDVWIGRPAGDGTLLVEGFGAPEGSPHRVPRGTPTPLRGEPDRGIHVVEIVPGERSPSAVLYAMAASRWRDRRYPWLPVERPAPPCLPLAHGCGCVMGCARGVAREPSEPDEPRARVRLADGSLHSADIERWCFDERGAGRPARFPEPPAGPRCMDVYVVESRCGGGCVPSPAFLDCAACEACDASCGASDAR